jgi:hypothetical protein
MVASEKGFASRGIAPCYAGTQREVLGAGLRWWCSRQRTCAEGSERLGSDGELRKSSTENLTYNAVSCRFGWSEKEGLGVFMSECGLTNICSATKPARRSFGIRARPNRFGGGVGVFLPHTALVWPLK